MVLDRILHDDKRFKYAIVSYSTCAATSRRTRQSGTTDGEFDWTPDSTDVRQLRVRGIALTPRTVVYTVLDVATALLQRCTAVLRRCTAVMPIVGNVIRR